MKQQKQPQQKRLKPPKPLKQKSIWDKPLIDGWKQNPPTRQELLKDAAQAMAQSRQAQNSPEARKQREQRETSRLNALRAALAALEEGLKKMERQPAETATPPEAPQQKEPLPPPTEAPEVVPPAETPPPVDDTEAAATKALPLSPFERSPKTWTAGDILFILQSNAPQRVDVGVYRVSAFTAQVRKIGANEVSVRIRPGDLGITMEGSSADIPQIDIERSITTPKADITAVRKVLEGLTETDVRTMMPETIPDIEPTAPTPPTTEPVDIESLVNTSRRQEPQAATAVPEDAQQALVVLGKTPDEWEAARAADEATAFLNALPQETSAQVEAVGVLQLDVDRPIEGDSDAAAAAAAARADAEATEEVDFGVDDDADDELFDVQKGVLRDISDEHRQDFDAIRRKLFLSRMIAHFEAKGTNRTERETEQLEALTAVQRTDAQQATYHNMLQAFVNKEVTRLSAKPDRTATEERMLSALTAVQAEGIPDDVSDRALYADLDTPEQEHSAPLVETLTLAGVTPPDTSQVDVNLPEKVTSDVSKISPAQLTGVRAILSAFQRQIHVDEDTTVQGGFLLGDKPGVGKTRQALATLWHYMKQGIRRHVVLAPNVQLLNNYTTDMQQLSGSSKQITQYGGETREINTPIAATTYSTLLQRPSLERFDVFAGNQNALADIIEHLTDIRPTFAQTHPEHHRAMIQAFSRIGIDPEMDVDTAVETLRAQARRVNRSNAAHVEQFKARVTPALAETLLSENQLDLFGGSELHQQVTQLLSFAKAQLLPRKNPNVTAAAATFDGVIILDEMHKAAGSKSESGRVIAKFHEFLPNAKFLYMSATPFKEIDNIAVAERLGLWGATQPFNSFQ